MHIEREYNIYKIYATPASKKPYVYNGEARRAFLTNGKMVDRLGSISNGTVQALIELLVRGSSSQNNNVFEIVNRVISYPADYNIKEEIYRCLIAENSSFYNGEINTRWKIILRMLKKEIPVQRINDALLHDLARSYFKDNEELEKFVYSAFSNYYSRSIDREAVLKQKAFRAKVKENFKKQEIASHEIEELAKNSVLMEILFNNEDVQSLKNKIIRNTVYKVQYDMSRCVDILDFAQKLGIEDYKISNFDRDYENLKMRYEKEKTQIENEIFKKHQTAINLEFENAEYKIYVPTSREELAEIGDYFNNCANGHEWVHYLENRIRHLVVVVEKSTNKWRVCCDIDSVSKEIRQYLTINNSNCIPEDAKQFKKEYQAYLNNI